MDSRFDACPNLPYSKFKPIFYMNPHSGFGSSSLNSISNDLSIPPCSAL